MSPWAKRAAARKLTVNTRCQSASSASPSGPLGGGLDQVFDLGDLSHIAANRQRLATVALQLRCRRLASGAVTIGKDHRRPLGRERLRDAAADTLGGSGYQRDAIAKLEQPLHAVRLGQWALGCQ